MVKSTNKTTKKTAAKAPNPSTAPAKRKTAAKKAATKKAAARKPVTKKVAAKQPAAETKIAGAKSQRKAPAKRPSPARLRRISADQRRAMIAEAAYLRAEAQGFVSDQGEDWLLAEAEIDAHLQKAGITVTG